MSTPARRVDLLGCQNGGLQIPPTQRTIMAPNEKQVEAWNGGVSVHYVDHADRYDRQLLPFTEELLEEVRAAPHRSLLDVGCGCGALTLAAARIADSAVGLDISVPLTDVASERARAAGIDNVELLSPTPRPTLSHPTRSIWWSASSDSCSSTTQ
jgi:tRNA/tmRNA/rRNA uracil-C5-methylase (TrmA/RlmC/RlmD family)